MLWMFNISDISVSIQDLEAIFCANYNAKLNKIVTIFSVQDKVDYIDIELALNTPTNQLNLSTNQCCSLLHIDMQLT